jgi:hypothetical protein
MGLHKWSTGTSRRQVQRIPRRVPISHPPQSTFPMSKNPHASFTVDRRPFRQPFPHPRGTFSCCSIITILAGTQIPVTTRNCQKQTCCSSPMPLTLPSLTLPLFRWPVMSGAWPFAWYSSCPVTTPFPAPRALGKRSDSASSHFWLLRFDGSLTIPGLVSSANRIHQEQGPKQSR